MQAFKTKRSLFTISGTLLLCSLLSACGQMGPLTLPQTPAEVAKPNQNNALPDENKTIKSAGEPSGPV